MVRNELAKRIETSYYRPGEKLSGVRRLAEEFGVSAVTVGEALRLLEKDDYLVCVHGSGTYVMEKTETPGVPLNIVFAFPEEAISAEQLGQENCAISSEAYRGLVAGAMVNNCKVRFEHFIDNSGGNMFRRQLKQLQDYDAAVFLGEQLGELQKELARTKPVFRLAASYEETLLNRITPITYDRVGAFDVMLRHVAECGYRSVGIVSQYRRTNDRLLYKVDIFKEAAVRNGLTVSDEFDWRFPQNDSYEKMLCEKLSGPRPDFIFVNHTDSVGMIYRYCYDRRIQIGEELGLAALATGFTFQGLIPALTYVRIPIFEIMSHVAGLLRNGVEPLNMRMTGEFLVRGQSTQPRS